MEGINVKYIETLKILKDMKNIDDPQTGQPKGFRIGFNIFMMIVYIAVGILFFTGFFNIDNKVISYCVGGLLVAYGIWRGVRMYIVNKDE